MNTGSCHSCSSHGQNANSNTSNNTNQVIVQYAPSTAVAVAVNYGSGSASATATAAPKLSASQSSRSRVDDPATNVGSGGSANNVTSDNTNQAIYQDGSSTANAYAVSYNGHASAIAVAAPTLIASQSANSYVQGSSTNIGLGGTSCGSCRSGHQSASNYSSNETNQSISQYAPTTASAFAASGSGCGCGSGSSNASAIAVAAPVLIASQTSTSSVYGQANNIGFGSGRQSAYNVSANNTDQYIDQDARTNAEANAVSGSYGYGNQQSATAVAVARPSEIAVEGSLSVVTGSANNEALGYGCDCRFGRGGQQSAFNASINSTDQDISQNGNSNAEANAFNGALGFGNHQYATAVAVAAPRLSASELSSAYVSGVATNVGLGRGSDQFAFNLSVNSNDQNIRQNGNSEADANAVNLGLGFGNNQNSQATAVADPSLSAGQRAGAVVTGQAINTDLGSSCGSCYSRGKGTQIAANVTYSDNDQSIDQYAPAHVKADAFNGGFDFGLGGWLDCGCYGSYFHGNGSNQYATAVAASGANLRASQVLYSAAAGRATNVGLGGRSTQVALNVTASDNSQRIDQDAPSYVTASAKNDPSWGFGFGRNSQNATAIAASAPYLTASQALETISTGSATNVDTSSNSDCGCYYGDFYGHRHGNLQVAYNLTDSDASQRIYQDAPTYVDARAENYPSTVPVWDGCYSCGRNGIGSVQTATAIAAANPVLGAVQANYISQTRGQATNVALGNSCSFCGFGHNSGTQIAANFSINDASQRIDQDAPAWVSANAENDGFGFGGYQQATAVAVAAPRLWADQYQYNYVAGNAANVDLSSGSGHQIAINVTRNDGDQSINQYAPSYVDAEAENSSSSIWGECGCHFGGFGGEQNATAIAGALANLSALQVQNNTALGSATNLNLGSSCGYCFFGYGHRSSQFAFNQTSNDVNQSIDQYAPAWVNASAENENLPLLWGCWYRCYGGPQNATAVATATPWLHASQNSLSGLHGTATNVNLSSNFGNCYCGCDWYCGGNRHNSQFAYNDTSNYVDQDLFQYAPAWSTADAITYPTFWTGLWGGPFGNCGCAGGLGAFHANVGGLPLFSAPSFSAPVAFSGLSLSGIGTNFNVGAPNLGIKLGLNVSNSEVLNLPSIGQILHGVSLFGLLHGLVSVNLSLSVTTPWVQVAVAIAHESPFAVLFSVIAQHNLAPWYGYLL